MSSNPSFTPQHSPSPEVTPGSVPAVPATTTPTIPPTPSSTQRLLPSLEATHGDISAVLEITEQTLASSVQMQTTTALAPTPPTTSSGESPWTPTHQPSWSLGPQHNPYVHVAAPYLIGVPGGPKWESLLVNYIVFESLSSAIPVSVNLLVDLHVH